MAGVFRVGIAKAIAFSSTKSITSKKLLPEVKFVRCISGRALRVDDPNKPKKPAPWPYQDKPYRFWHRIYDRTTSRFDENTKVSTNLKFSFSMDVYYLFL